MVVDPFTGRGASIRAGSGRWDGRPLAEAGEIEQAVADRDLRHVLFLRSLIAPGLGQGRHPDNGRATAERYCAPASAWGRQWGLNDRTNPNVLQAL